MIKLLNAKESWNQEQWDNCAEQSYYPYLSYTYNWISTIESYFPELTALPFADVTENGLVSWICPLFFNSKKHEITGSALLAPGFINKNENPNDLMNVLLDYANQEKCRKISIQIPPDFEYSNVLLAHGYILKSKVCFFELNIKNIECFETYTSKYITHDKRKNINTAKRKGVLVEMLTPSRIAVDRFYPFYLEMAETKGVIPLEKRFISALTESLHDNSQYWIAVVDNQDVGSALSFEFLGRMWLWLLRGSREYVEYRVDVFLYAEMIRYAFDRNLETIDFGTTPLDSSLAVLKKRLGAKPVFHEHYELDLKITEVIKQCGSRLKRHVKTKYGTNK
ncbi:MAG: GNAT family N-acetyltransferase [Pedobacter sp.]